MKKLHFLLSTFLVFIFTSCGEDELKGVVLSEDPGYVKEPLVAIQAEDGTGNWINGLIDQNSRVIALDFRILDDQSAVNVKLKLADEWAKPIDPLTTDAVLDLSSGITRIKVNDGADDIEYTIFSTSTQLLRAHQFHSLVFCRLGYGTINLFYLICISILYCLFSLFLQGSNIFIELSLNCKTLICIILILIQQFG